MSSNLYDECDIKPPSGGILIITGIDY